jgi:PASTA domain/Right handed beta helix region
MTKILGSLAAAFLLVLSSAAAVAEAAPASWYVATAGSDASSCAAPAQPCATINGAIGKASSGDTINVATGTYTGSGYEVVLIGKSVTLAGGWNADFTSRTGLSTVDGQSARGGIRVASADARIERFLIENGRQEVVAPGGASGIAVSGNGTGVLASLELDASTVRNNSPGGISSDGPLTITNSTISGNSSNSNFTGGGITATFPGPAALTVTNSTISGNTTYGNGGGILVSPINPATVQLSNVTIVDNHASSGGGVGLDYHAGTVHLRNSIVAGNSAYWTGYENFWVGMGAVVSEGYNMGTGFPPAASDLRTNNPRVAPLADNGGPTDTHAVLLDSAALDGGNPSGCRDENGVALERDQRGVSRPLRDGCDIGAFEADPPANDDFADASSLNGLSSPVPAWNEYATKEHGEPDHADNFGGASIWYAWTPSFTGTAFVSTAGSSFDTVVGVYTGSSVSSLTTVTRNDDATVAALSSKACFPAAAGTAYKVAVDGFADAADEVAAQGSVTLAWGHYTSIDPCPILPPAVTGTPQVGQTLTATTGMWAGTPSGFAYQWIGCDPDGCSELAGATAATYTPPADAAGLQLLVRVTAKHPSDPTLDAIGHSALTAPVTSPPPPPAPAGPPPPPPPAPPGPPPPSAQMKCVVPNVKGKTLARARRLLAAKRCALGRVTRVYSRKMRKGRVISQRPTVARRLPRGTRVHVKVSSGRRPS